jgi:hypothetical protein
MHPVYELKKIILEADLTETRFEDNDENIKFYTGIQFFLILQQIMAICVDYKYSSNTANSLTKF